MQVVKVCCDRFQLILCFKQPPTVYCISLLVRRFICSKTTCFDVKVHTKNFQSFKSSFFYVCIQSSQHHTKYAKISTKKNFLLYGSFVCISSCQLANVGLLACVEYYYVFLLYGLNIYVSLKVRMSWIYMYCWVSGLVLLT